MITSISQASVAPPVVVVGCGRMGGAFATAWRKMRRVLVHDPFINVLPDGCTLLPDLAAMPADALVLLAIKPQGLARMAEVLAPALTADMPIVSIMAGMTLEVLAQRFGERKPIVRAMPNTPISIGLGITALVPNTHVDTNLIEDIDALFRITGEIVWMDDEALLDAVTAVSGSGPAYFFRFAEALAHAGEARGLSPEIARRLAAATLVGAGGLAGSGDNLVALRDAVTSPGGTTAAALDALERNGIDGLVEEGVRAAAARSAELASTR